MEMLQFKLKFPREVLLCRVGDFYEAVGFDACILVEHAGLNPFGGLRSDSIPKAGCQVVNLRQILDDLIRCGYSVIEEGRPWRSGRVSPLCDLRSWVRISLFAKKARIEMSEIRSLVIRATVGGLVLIDEISTGTETAKGTCIAGSIIERLDNVSCRSIISTHLHGIFDLPLSLNNTDFKAMGIEVIDGCIHPTWRCICRESLAFQTARREGMPDLIIRRAEGLYLAMSTNKQISLMVNNESSNANSSANVLVEKSHSMENTFGLLRNEVESTVTMICKKKMLDLYNKRSISELVEVVCVAVGNREQTLPSTVGTSSIYGIIRSDNKLYVGQTDDLVGCLHAHRSKEGMQDATILYVVVPGKSVACCWRLFS